MESTCVWVKRLLGSTVLGPFPPILKRLLADSCYYIFKRNDEDLGRGTFQRLQNVETVILQCVYYNL